MRFLVLSAGGEQLFIAQQFTGYSEALAEKVVGLHHGRIWVDASPRGGAVFAFCIPEARIAE